MIEQVVEKIDRLVEEIHTPEQKMVGSCYIAFLDSIELFLKDMEQKGYTVDLIKDLERMQQAMEIKDYILLSDLLRYELRPDFVNLSKQLMEM